MTRSPSRRADDTGVVTIDWLRRWALRIVGVVFVSGLVLAWRVSAQVRGVQDDVLAARNALPHVEQQVAQLTEEVRLLRKGQDSLITLMTDRERRSPPMNPLGGR